MKDGLFSKYSRILCPRVSFGTEIAITKGNEAIDLIGKGVSGHLLKENQQRLNVQSCERSEQYGNTGNQNPGSR